MRANYSGRVTSSRHADAGVVVHSPARAAALPFPLLCTMPSPARFSALFLLTVSESTIFSDTQWCAGTGHALSLSDRKTLRFAVSVCVC